MEDAFYEQLVPVKRPKMLIYLGILLLAVILGAVLAVGFLFLGIAAIVVAWFVGMMFYFFVYPKFYVEYEYTLVNHSLDIDAVYHKVKRKHLFSVDLREAEVIAPENSSALRPFADIRPKNLTSRTGEYKAYSLIVLQDRKKLHLLIEPNEELLERIRQWSGRKFIAED